MAGFSKLRAFAFVSGVVNENKCSIFPYVVVDSELGGVLVTETGLIGKNAEQGIQDHITDNLNRRFFHLDQSNLTSPS